MNKNWEQQAAEREGFHCRPDERRGGNHCKYRKGEINVWLGGPAHPWIRTIKKGDLYTDHTYHPTLQEALKGENGKWLSPTKTGPVPKPK